MTDQSPVQPQLLSRINEALVLRAIREHGSSTRGELSQALGVTFPTVNKAVSSLLDACLLEEVDDVQKTMSRPGRPAKRLRLSKETAKVVGVAIDVRRCEVAEAGFDGDVRDKTAQSFATPPTYKGLLDALVERIGAARHASTPTLCVGLSVVGLIDYRSGAVRLAASLPYLNGMRLGDDLSARIDAPCALVHDTHALCLAECVYGRAGKLDNFAVLDVCTGVGLGVMVNGVFLTGHSGFAGEIGHIPFAPGGGLCRCGRRGCLETVASEWALVERVSQRLGREVTLDEIIALAQAPPPPVRAELNCLCKNLALAVAHVVNVFNPQCLYLAGRLLTEIPTLRERIVERARTLALEPAVADCQFLPATGGTLKGAVATAISAVTSSRVHHLRDTLNGIAFVAPHHLVD